MNNKKENKFDLTQGKILNKLLLVAVPIMGTQLMQMLYNLTDMFWLGRVGSVAVAASGTAGMYLWMSQAFLMIGRMGAEIGVSQSLGQKKEETAKDYSESSLFIALVLGALFGACLILFRQPLVHFFRIQDLVVVHYTEQYLAITGAAIPATYISGVIIGTFNASGNSRTPFYINAIGLILNIILDPLLIFTFDWGIAGAAIATSAAQYIVMILFLIAIKQPKISPFPTYRLLSLPKEGYTKRIFLWSTPIALESLLFTSLSMITSRFVAEWGTLAMAVQRVGSQVESLSWLIGGGFSSAVTAFMGQNYGARKWERIHLGYRISITAMGVWGIFITIFLAVGGSYLFSLFLPSETEAIKMGAVYLQILAVCQIAACLEYNSAGAFRGIGKTIPPSVVSIAGNVLRIPLIYYLSKTSLGLNGIWWGISIGGMIRSTGMFVWYLLMARKLPKENEETQLIKEAF